MFGLWEIYLQAITPWTNANNYHCITHSVTAHPDDGQTRRKLVNVTN
jgi:hypothetical protein